MQVRPALDHAVDSLNKKVAVTQESRVIKAEIRMVFSPVIDKSKDLNREVAAIIAFDRAYWIWHSRWPLPHLICNDRHHLARVSETGIDLVRMMYCELANQAVLIPFNEDLKQNETVAYHLRPVFLAFLSNLLSLRVILGQTHPLDQFPTLLALSMLHSAREFYIGKFFFHYVQKGVITTDFFSVEFFFSSVCWLCR